MPIIGSLEGKTKNEKRFFLYCEKNQNVPIMKIKVTLFLLVMLGFAAAYAQQAIPVVEDKIQFDETTHDFGKLKRGDPAEHTFTFTNVSGEPVSLNYVKASCGCTTPSWTREAVAPGGTGTIAVKYDSYRSGRFTKSVTVKYDSVSKPMILYIKGEVEMPPPSDEEIYAVSQGGLSFDKVLFNLGTINSNEPREIEFKVKNTSPHPISFTGKYEKEAYITVNPAMKTLNPGEKTVINLHFDGASFEQSQAVNTKIVLLTDDQLGEKKELTLSGRLNKVFSEEELAKSARIEFDQTEFKGQTVIEGEKLTVKYTFKNTGGQDLIIEDVRASCGCTATSPKDKVIAPGASSEITATFDSRGRMGMQRKSITVKSNDPVNGSVILRLEADVERDPFHADDLGPAANPNGGR